MFKKTLAWLLALMMLVCAMPLSVFATETTGVAQLNNGTPTTLQAAINAAATGDNTITLLGDCSESVTIKQTAGKNIVIDGANNVYTGTITIDGNSNYQSEEFLKFENIVFKAAISIMADGTSPHNVTFSKCEFITLSDYIINIRENYNWKILDCTVTGVGGAFMQAAAASNNLHVENFKSVDSAIVFKLDYCSGFGDTATFKNIKIENALVGLYISNRNAGAINLEACNIEAQYPIRVWFRSDGNPSKVTILTKGGENVVCPTGADAWLTYQGSPKTDVVFPNGEPTVGGSVAQIGENKYNFLQAAIDAAQDGDTVKLIANIDLTDTVLTVSGAAKMTIDLNGYKLTGTFSRDMTRFVSVTGGCELTLLDSSDAKTGGIHVIHTDDATSLMKNLIRVETDGKMVIESGNYSMDKAHLTDGVGMIDSRGDEIITVNGGNFHLGNVGKGSNKSPWIFNTSGQNTKNIIVNGGTFNADIVHQHFPFEVAMPKELALKKNDSIWTVVDAVAYVNEQEWSSKWYTNDVGYATLEEAIAAVEAPKTKDGKTSALEVVTLLKNVEVTGPIDATGIEIVCGEYKIVLADKTATLTAAANLPVTTNLSGYKVVYEGGVYKLTAPKVAQIVGGNTYATLQAAIDAAKDHDEIILLESINIANEEINSLANKYKTYYLVEGKTVTVNLNGKTISGEYAGNSMLVGVFSTDNNGHLTLTGNGTINVTAATTVYGLIVNFEDGCSITIENGTYIADKVSDSLIYTGGDEDVIINGGNFRLGNVGTGSNGSPWIFNASGQNTANIIVNGGTYNADIAHQYYPFEVAMPEELALKKNDSIWTVVDAVAYVNEQEWSSKWYTNDVGYATLEEAIAAVEAPKTKDGKTSALEVVTLLKNVEVTGPIDATGIEIVCGEYKIVLADKTATLTAAANLPVTTNLSGYTVEYAGGVYKLVEDPVAQIGETKYTSLQAAINAAKDGETITVIADHEIGVTIQNEENFGYETVIIVDGKNVTIDFNGYTVTVKHGDASNYPKGIEKCLEAVVFIYDNAGLTLTDSSKTAKGGFSVPADENVSIYSMFYNCGGKLTVDSGVYYMEKGHKFSSIVYAEGEHITIFSGGLFTLGNAGENSDTKPWIFNTQGKNDTFVTVIGGTYNQDILMNYGSQKDCEVDIPEGYTLVNNGDGTWTVKPYKIASVNMDLGNTLAMNFFMDPFVLDATLDEGNEDFITKLNALVEGWYVQITVNDGKPLTIGSDKWLYNRTKHKMYVTLPLTAKQMTDDITVQVFDASGRPVTGQWTGSVLVYANAMMAKSAGQNDVKSQQRMTLMVDMLNFGTAAQMEYKDENGKKGYNMDNLANAGLTADIQNKYATKNYGVLKDEEGNAQDKWTVVTDTENLAGLYHGMSLELGSDLNAAFIFNTAVLEKGYTVEISHTNYRNVTKITEYTNTQQVMLFNENGEQTIGFRYDAVVYADSCSLITIQVKDKNQNVVLKIQDSISYYVNRVYNGEEIPNCGDTLMKFSESARNYLGYPYKKKEA